MGFDGLLGNQRLKENLRASLSRGRISHFYLISGPAGSGKKTLARLLDTIGVSRELDMAKETVKLSFLATKDIRDKYVLSRLAWDLGICDILCDIL